VLWLFAVLLLVLLLLEPDLGRRIGEFFDATVFNKLQSDSGAERSAWNQQAWSNFVSTYGLGVGLGSGYASSYPLVLLSNLGIPGTLCFAAFVYQLLFARPAGALQSQAAVTRAARQAVLATLIAASLSAAVFYLGMAFFAFAAVAQGDVQSTLRVAAARGSDDDPAAGRWRRWLIGRGAALRPAAWNVRVRRTGRASY
jgi:ABC-type antimicrobial peptide transport system permease subunit